MPIATILDLEDAIKAYLDDAESNIASNGCLEGQTIDHLQANVLLQDFLTYVRSM